MYTLIFICTHLYAYIYMYVCMWGFLSDSVRTNLPAIQKIGVPSLSSKDPLKESMATQYSILPGEAHGQRSLAGIVHSVTKSQI